MRYDEAYSFLSYAVQAEPSAWFSYSAPNNHFLHTLLVHAATALGGWGPELVRLPAMLAGVLVVPAAGEFARRVSGEAAAGLIAAALAGSAGILVEYSVNARGYSLVCLAALLLGIFSHAMIRNPGSRRAWIGWTLAAGCGLWTIPIALYPVLIFVAVVILEAYVSVRGVEVRLTLLRTLSRGLAGTAALTALFYAPVLHFNGIEALVANEFVRPKPLSVVLQGLPGSAGDAWGHWTRDMSLPLKAAVVLGLAVCVLDGFRRSSVMWTLPLLAPVLMIASALIQRVVPFPRVWLFLLPMMLALAACGIARGVAGWGTRKRPLLARSVAVLLLWILCGEAAWRMEGRPYLISEDPQTLVEAGEIVRDVVPEGLCDGRAALVWDPHVPNWPPLLYYTALRCLSLSQEGFTQYTDATCSTVLAVTRGGQKLEGIYSSNPGLREAYEPLMPWRTFGAAQVYRAKRAP